MRKIIEKELDDMEPALKELALSKLVPLKMKALKWEYGNNETFPAWMFADLGDRNVMAVYCLGGHGAGGSPWGLTFGNDDYFGQDGGWYSSLKEMLLDAWDA